MNHLLSKAEPSSSAQAKKCWDLSRQAFSVTLEVNPELDLGQLAETWEPRIFDPPANPDQSAHYSYACYQAYRSEQDLKRAARCTVISHMGFTVPNPGRPNDWRSRLLPTNLFSEYKKSFQHNQEVRLNATLELAEIYYRILEIQAVPDQPKITLTNLTHRFREAARCAFQCDPGPTPAQYLQSQAKARNCRRRTKLHALLPQPVRQQLLNRQTKQDLARYNQTEFQFRFLPDFSQADPILRQYLPPSGFHNPGHYQAWHLWSHLPGIYHWNQWRRKKRQAAYNPTVSKNRKFP